MIIIRTFVDRSPLHGLGVFSKDFVPKGSKVWEFNPIFDLKVDPAEFEKLPQAVKEEIEIHMYVPEDGGLFYYETTSGKYMNHSRDPNVDFSNVGYGYALRDIQPGEELLCDYRQIMHDYSHISYL